MSRPTALPTRECFVGYAVKTTASFLSGFGLCFNCACRTAIPATRAARSGSATYTGTSPSPCSLKENGTVISRPSNSGIATCIAASMGETAASDASQTARDDVRHSPWRTGTFRSASAPMSQASSSPPADASDARVPPAASTVATSASARPSSSYSPASALRSEPQYTGRALAPRSSIRSHRTSTKEVLPDSSCAR